MPSLAEDLKQARENLGLSIADIAVRTRISKMFLEAIEKGEYDTLPGEVFILGFLRTFSREVGLNPNEVVRRYKEETGAAAVEQAVAEPPGEPDTDQISSLGFLRYLVPILVVIAAAYFYFSGGARQPEQKAVKTATPRPAATKPDVTKPVERPATANITTVTPAPEAPAHAIVLEIKAVAESWIAYESDGGERKDLGILMPGDEITVEADEVIMLDTGNAGGLEITYNGVLQEPVGSSGMVLRDIMYTPEKAGVRGAATGQRPNVPASEPQETPESTVPEPSSPARPFKDTSTVDPAPAATSAEPVRE